MRGVIGVEIFQILQFGSQFIICLYRAGRRSTEKLIYTLPETRARSLRLKVGGEKFGASSFRLTGSNCKPFGCDTGELLGLKEIYLSPFKHLDHVGREVR